MFDSCTATPSPAKRPDSIAKSPITAEISKTAAKAFSVTGAATQTALLAVLHALFCVFPVSDLKLWQPSHADIAVGTIRLFSSDRGQFYRWSMASGESQWCLPYELWPASRRRIRVLVFSCDEGSVGYSIWNFLASHVCLRLRTVFHRDPPHRLSNLFTNSMRGGRLRM
jgi:hypothetical protein